MAFDGVQLPLSGIPDYRVPCFGLGGNWSSAGGLAVRESLSRGSVVGVMDVLESMDAPGMASVLREAGFFVSQGAVERGCDAVLESVQHDLIAAAEMRVDGYGLEGGQSLSFAAKELEMETAEAAIQAVLRSDAVVVDLLGDARAGERGALLFVAGQALQNGLQGFGFEGIPGKYEVPLSMAEVSGLYGDAAQAVAVESARAGVAAWAAGEKVRDVSEWVPDSIQRLLNGSVSVAAADAVVNAIEGGAVGAHAREFGLHGFARLLAEQGFDVNAPTVQEQAGNLGLAMIEPDRQRGQYVGPMVGQDHRAGLIKFAREKGVELPFDALAVGQVRPKMGETVRMKFTKGDLAVSVAERGVGNSR